MPKIKAKIKTKKITGKETLEKILAINGAEEILAKHNVPCLGCMMMSAEQSVLTIRGIAKAYQIDEKKLLSDLNKAAGGK